MDIEYDALLRDREVVCTGYYGPSGKFILNGVFADTVGYDHTVGDVKACILDWLTEDDVQSLMRQYWYAEQTGFLRKA